MELSHVAPQNSSGIAQAPAGDGSYSYRASLVGAAHEFELTDGGLSWRTGGRQGVWPYDTIAAIRLSYRPVAMQSRRFRADLVDRAGAHLAILSTSWQTIALQAPQDDSYRRFVLGLHRRLAQAGRPLHLSGGLRRGVCLLAAGVLAIVVAAIAALFVRALVTGAFAGALFLIGFAALFGWQIGGFMWRNLPRTYTLDDVPRELLP
jgi:hypothetical protein